MQTGQTVKQCPDNNLECTRRKLKIVNHIVNSVNKLNVMYSSVNVYSKDKTRTKLQTKDYGYMPLHIIAIQEVKPKKYRYERISEEYKLDDYENIEYNLSNQEVRGMQIYVKKLMKYKIVDLNSRYCEYCSIEASCGSTDKLLFISVYRSPTSEDDNNKDLFELFQELNDRSEEVEAVVQWLAVGLANLES